VIYPSFATKRRAAAAAVIALGIFIICLITGSVADRFHEAAQHPRLDLEPLLTALGGTTDGVARQRLLERFVTSQPDLLAAIILAPTDTVEAAHPGREALVGRYLGPFRTVQPDLSRPELGPWTGPTAAMGGTPDPRQSLRRIVLSAAQRHEIANRVRALLHDIQRAGPATEVRSAPIYVHGQNAGRLYLLPRRIEVLDRLGEALGHLSATGAFLSCLIYWCMLPLWVLLDARTRTDKALPLAIFVFLTNFLGWLTYLVIRPEASRVCPVCITLLEPGFRLCPVCGWNAPTRCRQCDRPVRSHWHFCPYCEAPLPEGARDPLASDVPPASAGTA
jgi:hypothetical protein